MTTFINRGVTNVFERIASASKPIVACIGGANSSKSYSIAQLFYQKFMIERNKTFLICRKTMPALRLTAYKLIVDMMKEYGNYRFFKHNKSENTLQAPEFDNLMVFTSIDDPEKIKSTEFNYEWLEEANEFTWDDFIILKLRLRRKSLDGAPNQMFLSFNPSDDTGWINQRLFQEPDVERIHSTYRDNPFAQEEDIKRLEGLKDQDESYWLIYAEGEYAKITGLIHRLNIVDSMPREGKETIYGLDFGFVNPNALLQIGVDLDRMALYLTELLYESGQTNPQLIERMKEIIPPELRQREIYADSAEPARIEEIYNAGFNVHGAFKGPPGGVDKKSNVVAGIEFVNRFTLYTTEESINLKREMRGYKRKVDRMGLVLEEPIKFNDHFPNALRYAVYTHLRERLIGDDEIWAVHVGMKENQEKTGPGEAVAQDSGEVKATARGVLAEKPSGRLPGDEPRKKQEDQGREEDGWIISQARY